MATLAELRAAYGSYLGSATVDDPVLANDAYELYAFTLILQAAEAEGCNPITFQTRAGTVPTALKFRTSPGSIYSGNPNFCHANLSFSGGLNYEVHIGIYVSGVAGVRHECDVAVVKKAEADFCRAQNVHPRRAAVLLAAECKFYVASLGIALGREFLGTTTDLSLGGRFMLSNSDGTSVDRMLSHHKRQRQSGLSPLSPVREARAIAQFAQVFHDTISSRR